jgi:Ca2+-binding RTX toxin-like protein
MALFQGDDHDNQLPAPGQDNSGDDQFYGYGGNDVLSGGAGNDLLVGGAGADTLSGGAGIDTISYFDDVGVGVAIDLSARTAAGGWAAGDVIGGDIENINGSTLADTLTGSAAANTLFGDLGNDRLSGLDGADTLQGGWGNDQLSGGAGNDWLDGGQGDGGSDQLSGGDGNDILDGAAGNDILNAGGSSSADADTLRGGAGADQINGWVGHDTATYSEGTVGVTVNLATGLGSGGNAQGDVLHNVENLIGTSAADTLIGSSDSNTLNGGAGNDTLYGVDSNDVLVGGAGADHLDGGLGIDIAAYTESAVGVTIDLTAGTGRGDYAEGDTLVSIESVYGSTGADHLSGSAAADTLLGYLGDDVLRGGGGADLLDGGAGTDIAMYSENSVGVTINLAAGTGVGGTAQGDVLRSIEGVYGGAGNDTLVGTTGANTLVGGGGNDLLIGGAGKDTLAGGAGADRFTYAALGDSTVAAPERITDFSHVQGDRIDLHGIDASTATAGDQAFHFIGSAAFGHHAGELHESVAGGVTTVSGDVNGDGAADFSITLTGSLTLTAGDFVL